MPYPFGLSEEDLRKLIEETGGDFTLIEQRLRDYVERGLMSTEQAADFFDYMDRLWAIAEAEEPEYAALPAGQTARDVYARYIARNLPVSPEDWERLKTGLAMERQALRGRARVETQRALYEGKTPEELRGAYAGTERLLGIAQEYARRGMLEKAREASGEWLQAEYERQEGRRLAEAGEKLPSGASSYTESGYYATPRPLATGGYEVGMPSMPVEPYVPPYEPPEEPEVTGPQLWRDWFERRYPRITREFMTWAPKERTEESWAKYFEKERTKLREQWWRYGPYARGERPAAYQPRIQTVRF